MSDFKKQKQDLRELTAKTRSQIAPPSRAQMSAEVAERVLSSFVEEWQGKVIAGFLPLGSEIDPLPLMEALKALNITTALPRVAQKDHPLVFHAWSAGDPFEIGPLKAPEPPANTPVVVPDIILMPLLAFDNSGSRLGWGGGYYDRTLEALEQQNHKVFKLGLAFACQQVKRVPTGWHDYKLDAVMTEKGLIDANKR